MLFEAIEQFNLLLKDSRDNEAVVEVLRKLVPAFQHATSVQKAKEQRISFPMSEHIATEAEDTVH